MPNTSGIPVKVAKEKFLDMIAEGRTVEEAVARVGRTKEAYKWWRKTDPEFVDQMELRRNAQRSGGPLKELPPFGVYSGEYLSAPLGRHQQNWVDVLEGREPSWMHDSITFQKGRRQLVIMNVPPGHGKTTTITTNYVTWRIQQDPNIRVIVISETTKMAKKMMYAITHRLTHPQFRALQRDFGPGEGYKASAHSWTQTEIYVGDKSDGEKDPTLQALGIGSQIYGARADLIVVDDAVTLRNAHQYEDQIDWLTQEVLTRLTDDGVLLLVGTRVAPTDLYSELRKRFPGEWTYLAMPAVLEYADRPEDWDALWPDQWDGVKLARRKAVLPERTWAMAYQQLDVDETSTFPLEKVRAATNGQRSLGRLVAGGIGHRKGGMEGLTVVAGVDPATVGHTAAVCLGLDRNTRVRHVIDLYNRPGTTPGQLRDLFKRWTEKYNVSEWRVEQNAFQRSLVQDEELRRWLHERGSRIVGHSTGNNKWDADFGVASMETLFADADEGRGLIELTNPAKDRAANDLVEQLVSWSPEWGGKTDLVMALWFAEIRCRELIQHVLGSKSHASSRNYLSPGRRKAQQVINLEDVLAERRAQEALTGGW